jgi:serine/threonine protein kinase
MAKNPATIGRYQVRDRLGQGGMGVLYLALDPAIDRLVALKLLRVDSDELRERFLREARLAARLQHPNIVTIYDVGEHEEQPFIAMEYIAGETLAELIQRRAALSLVRKLSLMLDACKGLAYAHKHAIVHRDIKPANLMVGRDTGVLKVLDFGIARGGDSTLTQVGMLMGTPNYMSPEQIEGRTIDQRSDIFALGLVLYELLVYRQAFKSDTPHAVLHQVLHGTPAPLREIDPEIDPALVAVVDKAIAKSCELRYQDLDALRGDLARIANRLDAEGDMPTGPLHLPRQARPSSGGGGGGERTTDTPENTSETSGPPDASVGPGGRPATGGRERPGRTRLRESDRARLAERRASQVSSHLAAGETALAAGDIEGALAAAESAALLDAEDGRVSHLLEQVRAATEAREIAAWLTKARAHLQAGALTDASLAVAAALRVDQGHADAQKLRSEIERAADDRDRRMERDRQVRQVLEHLDANLAAGMLDAALRASVEALGYDPESPQALAARRRVVAAVEERVIHAIAATRADIAGGRLTSAAERLRQFTPKHERIDRELADVQRRIEEAEAARLRAEEEARRKAEEEARRLAAEAEEEARRQAAAEEAHRLREAEVARLRAEAVAARKRGEEEARRKAAEAEARRQREAEEARKRAEEEAARKATEEEARRLAKAEAKRKADEEAARLRAEEEARRKAAEEARRAEEEAQRQREAEEDAARQAAEEEARRLAEVEAKRKADEEAARLRAEEEARRKAAAEEARRLAEAEAKRKADEEAARLRAEEEARREAAEEAQRQREAEAARQRAEEEAARQAAEEEARRLAEAEAKRKADEEAARLRAEEEAARLAAEEEARRLAEAEARRKAEEEVARERAEEDARRKAAEEAKRLAAEDEARRKVEAEAQRKEEEDARRRRAEEEAARKAAEVEARRKAAEEAKRRTEDEARRKAAVEETRRQTETGAARKRAEEEAARRTAEAEARRLTQAREKAAAEEAARKAAADAEAKRKATEDETTRKAAAEATRKAAEEETRRKTDAQRRIAEVEAARRAAAEAEARRLAEEETARIAAAAKAEAARKQAEEETARKAAAAAEAEARRKAALEEEARRKAEAEARRKEEEDTRRRRAEEETARKAAEETARKAAAEAKRRADAEARRRAAEDEARRKAEAKQKPTDRKTANKIPSPPQDEFDTQPGIEPLAAQASASGTASMPARASAAREIHAPASVATPADEDSRGPRTIAIAAAAALLLVALAGGYFITRGGRTPDTNMTTPGANTGPGTTQPDSSHAAPNPGGTPPSPSTPNGPKPSDTPASGATVTNAPATPDSTAPPVEPGGMRGTPAPAPGEVTPPDATIPATGANRLDDFLASARRQFTRGPRDRALDTIARAPAEFRADPKFHALLGEWSAAALSDAERARSAALRANASTRAPQAFQQADTQWRAASAAAQRPATIDTVRSLLRAEELLTAATTAAGQPVASNPTEPANPPAKPPTSTPPGSNPPVTVPDRPATPAQPSGGETTTPRPNTPPPTTTPAPAPNTQTPARPAVDDGAAIQQALNAWAAAYASLDVSRVASVAPLSSDQVRSLQSAFALQSSHKVTLSGCKIQNSGAAAKVSCRVDRAIAFKDGKSTTNGSNLTFELAKRGDAWTITSQR